MTKSVLSVRIDSSELEKFDAMAKYCGQTRSEFLKQMISEFAARTYDASRSELLAVKGDYPPERDGRTSDVPD